MDETTKVLTHMVMDYKDDCKLLAKICKLISKIKNARVKLKFEEMFVDELMILNKRIKGLEKYLDNDALHVEGEIDGN